jgi:hypothetical protein
MESMVWKLPWLRVLGVPPPPGRWSVVLALEWLVLPVAVPGGPVQSHPSLPPSLEFVRQVPRARNILRAEEPKRTLQPQGFY